MKDLHSMGKIRTWMPYLHFERKLVSQRSTIAATFLARHHWAHGKKVNVLFTVLSIAMNRLPSRQYEVGKYHAAWRVEMLYAYFLMDCLSAAKHARLSSAFINCTDSTKRYIKKTKYVKCCSSETRQTPSHIANMIKTAIWKLEFAWCIVQ